MGMQGQGVDNMQMPGTPSMSNRTATGMAGAGQMGNMNNATLQNLNPQQRQLLLMQMQMRTANGGVGGAGAGGMPNMGNMNPQMALQERQRMELQQQQARMLAQRQQQGSPLNPNSGGGMGGTPDQFSPGAMRTNSNPNIGISQNARSPSVGDVNAMGMPGTPRVSGRVPSGTEEYQRQLLAAQRQQMQNQQNQHQQGFPGAQGVGGGNWQQQQQMGMPAGGWPQQNQQFGMAGNMPSGGNDLIGIPSRSSATPAPMSNQQSPTVPQTDMNEYMKW